MAAVDISVTKAIFALFAIRFGLLSSSLLFLNECNIFMRKPKELNKIGYKKVKNKLIKIG